MREVRSERTFWRDEAISQRHRNWGWDCPAIDIDFLLIEYDRGKAMALIEYKNEHAGHQSITHPSYKALINLGNRAHIPVFRVRYADNFSWWFVHPLNPFAKKWLPKVKKMPEKEWVQLLYQIRGRKVSDKFLETICNAT